MTNTTQNFPVYFGYFGNPAEKPHEGVAGVQSVIRAVNDLLYNYKDPNNLGEDPDSDVRAGIHHILEACAMQLEAINGKLTDTSESFVQDSPSHGEQIAITEPVTPDIMQRSA